MCTPSPITCRFNVYDNDVSAPARFLLPFRNENRSATTNLPPPGVAGRWQLPQNLSGMYSLAQMMTRVDAMNSTLVIYELLQGIVLLGLIFRLIMYLSFQKRLSVIGGTLVSVNWCGRSGKELSHLTSSSTCSPAWSLRPSISSSWSWLSAAYLPCMPASASGPAWKSCPPLGARCTR